MDEDNNIEQHHEPSGHHNHHIPTIGLDHQDTQYIMQPKMDWEYAMRREMQEIVPSLYLGPYAAAMKSRLDVLLSLSITHIVCIRQALEAHFIRPNFSSHFKYLVIDISDCPTENIIQHFRPAKEFITEALDHGGKVLVHGNGGICRSAAVVTAFIMERYNISCSNALAVVRNHRFCICVNEGFLQQLMEYEHIYKAEQQMKQNNYPESHKRKREVDAEDDDLHTTYTPLLPAANELMMMQ